MVSNASIFFQILSHYPYVCVCVMIMYLLIWVFNSILKLSRRVCLSKYVQVCADVHCALVCVSVHNCVRVWLGVCAQVCASVCRCAWICADLRECAHICGDMHGCVWDEFSEYLLETRFLTLANHNMHPLRIIFSCSSRLDCPVSSTISHQITSLHLTRKKNKITKAKNVYCSSILKLEKC